MKPMGNPSDIDLIGCPAPEVPGLPRAVSWDPVAVAQTVCQSQLQKWTSTIEESMPTRQANAFRATTRLVGIWDFSFSHSRL